MAEIRISKGELGKVSLVSQMPGIYLLRYGEKTYVGEATLGLRGGLQDELRAMEQGKHVSSRMQAIFDKHGASAFRFEILEYVEEAKCSERAQHYIDTLKPDFNPTHTAKAPAKTKTPKSPSLTRRPGFSPSKKPFELIEEATGKVISGLGLHTWCEEQGLNQGNLHKVLSGKRKSSQGYTANPPLTAIPKEKSIKLREVATGVVLEFESHSEAAKVLGLSNSNVSLLARNAQKTRKGWALA